MTSQARHSSDSASRTYIHRRFAVRFLVVLLVLLSVASFASIALGWGTSSTLTSREDSATPTKLSDMSPFYVLLVGSDSLAGTALYTGDVLSASGDDDPNADSVLLVRVDPADCVLTFVTVPSNTVLDDADSTLRETLAADDATQTVRTVERITGVTIRYYFVLGFSGFEALVEQIGGVTEDVPVAITMQDPVTARAVEVPSGENVQLDAAEALAYLRSWDPYTVDGDAHRQLNVRNVMEDLAKEVLDSEDDQVRKVLGVLEQMADTNIDDSLLLSLVTRFYDERENVKVYACTGPYLSSEVNDAGEAVITLQMAAWRQLMTVVDSGEDPARMLPQYDFQGSTDDYVKADAAASSSSSASKGKSASTSSSKASGKSSSSSASSRSKASASSAASESGSDSTSTLDGTA